MHQFWFTINTHDSSYRFKIRKKRFTLNMEVFREIFHIYPILPNQDFDELLSDKEIVSFIKELGHKGNINQSLMCKGIDLLSDVAALEAARLKKVIKRSKQDTSIHQAGGSGDGTDYVPTDAKMNDEIKDVDEEEYKRISEELSGDINVRLTDADCSISSKFTNAMLNPENLNAGKTKSVSLLDITVQHEAPHTLPLLTIHVFVIPKQIVFNPSDTVTTAPAPTISLLLSSLYLTLQQITPILTPTTEATTSTIAVPEYETLSAIHQRITYLEKDFKQLKSVDNSTKVISAIKFEVLNAVKEYLESSLDDALYKVIQKHSPDIIKEYSVLAKIVDRLK
nr:hypothetical protein [Tanacetum cinerariifolium]